jgi:hypothetical protein
MSEQKNVYYRLSPLTGIGVPIIERNNGIPRPSEVSCVVEADSAGLDAKIVSDLDGKCIKYVTSDNPEEQLYTRPVPVGSWEWIDFILYDGEIVLDSAKVPVLERN